MSLISIHAPVKGATGPGHGFDRRLADFNPRTREGCDRPVSSRRRTSQNISIHAPVKGATLIHKRKWLLESIFQSTHP